MAYSLASWDAEMARPIIQIPKSSTSKFQARNFQVPTSYLTSVSFSRSTTTYSEIEILQSNLPTIILQIKFFKLMFKTDCKQSLVEVSTRVKVPSPVSSSAYLSCSSNKYV